MENKDLYTVKEVSEILDTTPQTIYNHLNRLDKRKYTRRIKNVIHVTVEGLEEIKKTTQWIVHERKMTPEQLKYINEKIKEDPLFSEMLRDNKTAFEAVQGKEGFIIEERKDINILEEQIKVKDEQIKDLHKLLDQQQQLTLQKQMELDTVKEVLALKEPQQEKDKETIEQLRNELDLERNKTLIEKIKDIFR